jgi:signal transduction histidine kinase
VGVRDVRLRGVSGALGGVYAGGVRAARAIAIDLLLAGAVLLAGIVQWATRNFADVGPRPAPDALATAPDAVGLLLVALAATAVLLRRRLPLTALALACGTSVAALALRYGVVVHLGPAVVLYEIARRDERWRWWAGGAIAAATLAAVAVLERDLLDARAEFVIDAVLWAGAALAGAWQRAVGAREAERRRQEQLSAAAEERVRIARELHDSAGHAITNIAAHAGAARVLRERDPGQADAAVATVETLARQALAEIDDIVSALRDDDAEAALCPLPGLSRLDELVAEQRAAGLAVRVECTGAAHPLAATVDRAAYRIVQEGLTNAARHGDGSAALQVRYGGVDVVIELVNTVGGAPASGRKRRGRGILGMRERAAMVGGTLTADEQHGQFTLRAVLPYER